MTKARTVKREKTKVRKKYKLCKYMMIILLRLKTWKNTVKSTTEHENVMLI